MYKLHYDNFLINEHDDDDGLAVTFGTARRGVGGVAAHPDPSSLYQM